MLCDFDVIFVMLSCVTFIMYNVRLVSCPEVITFHAHLRLSLRLKFILLINVKA